MNESLGLTDNDVEIEEIENLVSDDYKSPVVQISMRISYELIAKCALIVKKFGLPYPNTINPQGKPTYNRFIRTVFFTLIEPYFTGPEKFCQPPTTDAEINSIILQLQENRLDSPLTYSLGGMKEGTKEEAQRESLDPTGEKFDHLLKAMEDSALIDSSADSTPHIAAKGDLDEL